MVQRVNKKKFRDWVDFEVLQYLGLRLLSHNLPILFCSPRQVELESIRLNLKEFSLINLSAYISYLYYLGNIPAT